MTEKSSVWSLFPYPSSHADGERYSGSIIPLPIECSKCPDRPCEDDKSIIGEITACRYGIHYVRATDDIRIIGLVVTDSSVVTKQTRKKRRSLTSNHVKVSDVRRSLESASILDDQLFQEFEERREGKLKEMLDSGQAFEGVLADIHQGLNESLNRSHDFLQLVKQIRGHVVAILERRYPGEPPEVSADKLPMEGAIFFATELLQGKIDATIYLNEPNRVFGQERDFELHRYVTKYFRIYRSQTNEKEVNLVMSGTCRGKVRYNASAVGVVIHALLDNLVKYAPPGSRADVHFTEAPDDITLEFSSLGPKIEVDELSRIYLPGFRASAARDIGISGLGLGLGAAKKVSDMLELHLSVGQEAVQDRRFSGFFSTTFSLTFEKI